MADHTPFAWHSSAHPASAVELACSCRFFNLESSPSLVVASADALYVYKIVNPTNNAQTGSDNAAIARDKLELALKFPLFGKVESMCSARLLGAKRESLFLTFSDAKLSVVEYEPSTNDLKTVSMHAFEDEGSRDGRHRVVSPPIVKIDPEGRCAVLCIYGQKFVVIPLAMDKRNQLSFQQRFKSYIISFDPTLPIRNIVGFEMMGGFTEPTLAILYEPVPTWVGRYAVTRDTRKITALSLNIVEQTHAVIWNPDVRLPSDLSMVYSIPRPLGGLLCLGANSIIYLNQSTPPHGISLNQFANKSSFLYKQKTQVPYCFDACAHTLLDKQRIALLTKDGQLCLITLVSDGRSIQTINLEPQGYSRLTCCMCAVGSEYLFLGGRLADSLLLRVSEVDGFDGPENSSPSKRRRLSSTEGNHDFDDLFYTDEHQSEMKQTDFKFVPCDSLMNIAPVGDWTMGYSTDETEIYDEDSERSFELVTCSGFGKNGALSIMKQQVRPNCILKSNELKDYTSLWAVFAKGEKTNEDNERTHQYLILSKVDQTIVLSCAGDLVLLDSQQSGFYKDGQTVFAGNIGGFGNQYILQVTENSAYLLDGPVLLHQLAVGRSTTHVIDCQADGCHGLLLMSDGSGILLSILHAEEPRLHSHTIESIPSDPIVAMSTFTDKSKLLMVGVAQEHNDTKQKQEIQEDIPDTDLGNLDDDDELLYEVAQKKRKPADTVINKDTKREQAMNVDEESEIAWCAICRKQGSLELFQIVKEKENLSLRECFLMRGVSLAPRMLVDTGKFASKEDKLHATEPKAASLGDSGQDPTICELQLVSMGKENKAYLLIYLSSGHLGLYEAFNPIDMILDEHQEGRLITRFKKLDHSIILDAPRKIEVKKKEKKKKTKVKKVQADRKNIFHPFKDINGYDGVLISGNRPMWVMMGPLKELRYHKMWQYGPLEAFSEFSNASCPQGFVSVSIDGTMRIMSLQPTLNYDSHFITRKVPLKTTPVFIEYHHETEVYALVTRDIQPSPYAALLSNEEPPEQPEPVDRGERHIAPDFRKFAIQIVSPGAWKIVPKTTISMRPFDEITTCKVLELKSKEHSSGKRGFVVLGITRVCGEEVSTRGRIMILDVLDVVPEPGQPLTKNKFKVLYDQVQKGAVTQIASVRDFLLTCNNQKDGCKVYVWNFENKDSLIGIAYCESKLTTSTVSVIKDIVVLGDMFQSVSLLRFQEEEHIVEGQPKVGGQLTQISEDIRHSKRTVCTQFYVNKQTLGILATDMTGNLYIYVYAPEDPDTRGGRTLLKRADFNLGGRASAVLRISCPSISRNGFSVSSGKHTVFYGSNEGSIGLICPIEEMEHRRLYMLQNKLTNSLQHYAGLNPKSYRVIRSQNRLTSPSRNVLDGDLLFRFNTLGISQQQEIARKIGASVDTVLKDLKAITESVPII
eukprot:m.76504 g.76504  ORF g.76504 m.76504 type:complete len:1426 (+) comp12562_c0_seq2:121-4398(+)